MTEIESLRSELTALRAELAAVREDDTVHLANLEITSDALTALRAERDALKNEIATRVTIAIARIERGEPGAALTGLMAWRGDFDGQFDSAKRHDA